MALPLIISLLSIILIFLSYYSYIYQRLRFKLPPGPRPLPIVGNLYDVKPVKFRCFAEWSQVFGPIISVWMGSMLHVVVSSSELAKEVLREKDQQLADRHRSRTVSMTSPDDGQDLVWADYGPHYVKVRKVCTLDLFSQKRIEALRPIREEEVAAMVESLFNDCTNPENLEKGLLLRKYLGAVAFNNITRLAFGKRFMNTKGEIDDQGLELKSLVAFSFELEAKLTLAEHIPWLRWMFPLEEDAFAKHRERRDRLTKAIMEEHTFARHMTGDTKQHFVDALLTSKEEYELSEVTIIGLLWNMMHAGIDTTSIIVEWAMAELIKNPRVQHKAQEELDRVIGSNRVMTESDFSNLPYLQCVAKEALRLHPPTTLMLPHKANSNVKIGGYDIPKGSIVHVNVWAVGRDPTVWKNPAEFRPERFLEEDVDMKGHDFRLLPFGLPTGLSRDSARDQLGDIDAWSPSPPFLMDPTGRCEAKEIDMSENPGMVTYMRTPLHAIAKPRLAAHLYKD